MAWSFRQPDAAAIARFLAREGARPYSYADVGATREEREPTGFAHDHNRQLLGHGAEAFVRACAALRAWRSFPQPWTAIANADGAIVTAAASSHLVATGAADASTLGDVAHASTTDLGPRAADASIPPIAPIAPIAPIRAGVVVGVLIYAVGGWWLNSARIVYVIDEPRRFGFAYGTLPGHAECGEERFVVEHLADDAVWYDLRAFSRPRHWVARAGYPLTRALQRRFARHSKQAMREATDPRRVARVASRAGPGGSRDRG